MQPLTRRTMREAPVIDCQSRCQLMDIGIWFVPLCVMTNVTADATDRHSDDVTTIIECLNPDVINVYVCKAF